MKNYIAKADKKTSSTDRQYSMFVGRWQPLHAGHQWLFNQSLEEGKNVPKKILKHKIIFFLI